MVRFPQDLSEDLSSHLLPSPSSQLRYRTTLTLQPSRGKTSFSCPSTENGALRVPSSEGWLSSAALKRGTSCSDAGNFKHWGWRWRTQQTRSPNPRHAGTRCARGVGLAELGSGRGGKECPGTPRSRAGDPAGRRGVNTNPLPGDHTSASPRVPKTTHSPWGQGRKT